MTAFLRAFLSSFSDISSPFRYFSVNRILLFKEISLKKEYSGNVLLYGDAIKKFSNKKDIF